MREYDLFLPSAYNDGRPVEAAVVEELKRRLRERFGGLTYFPHHNEGQWQLGRVLFKEGVTIIRVLADERAAADAFFASLKDELKARLEQEDILIVARDVDVV